MKVDAIKYVPEVEFLGTLISKFKIVIGKKTSTIVYDINDNSFYIDECDNNTYNFLLKIAEKIKERFADYSSNIKPLLRELKETI